jgi:hypothetical protein
MKEAYGMLYAIENGLRRYIRDEMMSRYGPNWERIDLNIPFRRRPLSHSYFYDLENYLRFYDFKIPHGFILNLKRLYPIRNKIAHCHVLTEEEYQTLKEAYEMIMNVVYSKVP